jgi:TonB family protein
VLEEIERRPVQTRWGWLAVSLGLLALACFVLYPSVESLVESEPAPAQPLPTPLAAPAPSAPVAPPPRIAPHVRAKVKTVVAKTVVAKAPAPIPIRQEAPTVPGGIRSRIHGVIPIDVSIQIGKNGKVEHAETAANSDAVRSHLAKQALRAVKHWKFQPMRVGQKPVRTTWIVSFRFRSSQNGTNWRLLRPSS